MTPEARKEIAGEIAEDHDISITRACRLMGGSVGQGRIAANMLRTAE